MHRNFSVFLQVRSGAGGAARGPTLPPITAPQNPEVAQDSQPAHGPRGEIVGRIFTWNIYVPGPGISSRPVLQ